MTSRLPLGLRGAATTPALSMFLIIVIAVLSYLGVAVPALLAEGRTATVQRAAASVPELAAWPSAMTPAYPAFGDIPGAAESGWGSLTEAITAQRDAQPEPLRGLLGTPRVVMMIDMQSTVDTNPARTETVPQNRVALVSDPESGEHARIVDGRLPELSDPRDGIDVALTEEVAKQLAWNLGESRTWGNLEVTLTGIVAPHDARGADWAFISGSATPAVEVTAGGDRVLTASAFMHADEATRLAEWIRDIKVHAWIPLDVGELDAATAEQVAAQLRLLPADPVNLPVQSGLFFQQGMSFLSALPQAMDTGFVRAEVMTAVITVVATGPILVALVVLALLGRLIAMRRVESSRVLRARGASTSRLIAILGGEGAALGLLGAALGCAAAALRPGWASWGVIAVPLLLAAVPAVTIPWGVLTEAERQGRADLGNAEPTSRAGWAGAGWRRAVSEILVLAATIALAVLVAVGGGSGGADPLLLALLVMLGISGTVLSLRILPVLVGVAERRGKRRADLTSLLGPARARRDRVVRTAPVLGVVVGLGVAVFSVAFTATVSGGIVRSAELSIGADVRVDGAYMTAGGVERVNNLDSVRAIAGVRAESTLEVKVDGEKARARVYTLDRDAFAKVQAGAKDPLLLPDELTAARADGADGADGAAIPVVVSEQLLEKLGQSRAATSANLADLDGLDFTVDRAPVRVVGIAPSHVPFGTAEQWIIVDDSGAAALGEHRGGLSQLYLTLAPGADPEQVGAAAAEAVGNDATYGTPEQAAAEYLEDPAYGVVQGALLIASAVVAMLLALATVATLMLGAASRARMVAILRTLGFPPRSTGRLVAWEVGPALVTALPFGVGAGLAMAWLVIPQLDLRGFVGGAEQPPVDFGGVWLPAVIVGFTVVATVAVVTAAALASRLGSATAIRAGDE